MMASLLGASFEAFVIDDEMLSHIQRTIRGVEVNDETLGFDSIIAAVTGSGHFIDAPNTLVSMERDYYPTISDREEPAVWQERGSKDMWQRAREQVNSTLSQHHPAYLSADTIRSIGARWPIRLCID